MKKLSHVNARGEASMVDVSAKPVMRRIAIASGEIRLQKTTLKLIHAQAIVKGNEPKLVLDMLHRNLDWFDQYVLKLSD